LTDSLQEPTLDCWNARGPRFSACSWISL